jgi:hypothetical protein
VTEETCSSGSKCDSVGNCVYDQENAKLSNTIIAIIVVASIVGVSLIIVVVVVVARKHKARQIEYVDGYSLLNTKK